MRQHNFSANGLPRLWRERKIDLTITFKGTCSIIYLPDLDQLKVIQTPLDRVVSSLKSTVSSRLLTICDYEEGFI